MYCFGDPAKMSDEKVRLALRVHDEVNDPICPEKIEISKESSTDPASSVTAVTCSDPIFALVVHISSTALKRQLRKHRSNVNPPFTHANFADDVILQRRQWGRYLLP